MEALARRLVTRLAMWSSHHEVCHTMAVKQIGVGQAILLVTKLNLYSRDYVYIYIYIHQRHAE